MRQLSKHQGAVLAIAINDLTGAIVTCSRDVVYLWTINGKLLAASNSIRAAGSPITCVVTTG